MLARFRRDELARGSESVHAPGGSGVENDAEPVAGHAHPIAKPAERNLFEFGDGRRRLPVKTVGVEGGDEHFAKDGWPWNRWSAK